MFMKVRLMMRRVRFFLGRTKTSCALLPTLCAALLFCPVVNAAGLGDMELFSKFNEPLEARIPLYLKGVTLDSSSVGFGIASAEEFKRFGLNWDHKMQLLEFEYVDSGTDQYLTVRSRERIREPVLSLVVYLETVAGGRILRTYLVPLEVEGR